MSELTVRRERRDTCYFTQVPNVVFHLGLSHTAFKLYMHLLRSAGAHRDPVSRSEARLARECGMGRSTVQRAKRELLQPREELGGKALCTIFEHDAGGNAVRHELVINDIWPENMTRFSKESRPVSGSEPTRLSTGADPSGDRGRPATGSGPTRLGTGGRPASVPVKEEQQEEEPTTEEQKNNNTPPAVAVRGAKGKGGAVGSSQSARRSSRPTAPLSTQRWAPFYRSVSDAFGGARVVNSRTGAPLAWVGELAQIAGKHANDDPIRASALWGQYRESEQWRYRPRDLRRLPAEFGAWITEHAVAPLQPIEYIDYGVGG